MVKCEAKLSQGQVEGPSSLPEVQLLRVSVVLQVLVVCPALILELCPFKEVPPLFQCLDML